MITRMAPDSVLFDNASRGRATRAWSYPLTISNNILIRNALASETPVVASVAQRGGGFIAEVKARWDVRLLNMDWDNRDQLLPQVLGHLP